MTNTNNSNADMMTANTCTGTDACSCGAPGCASDSASDSGTAERLARSKTKYIDCTEASLPSNLRFCVVRSTAGQMIEISYASPGRRDEACAGDEYRQVLDRTTGRTTYARRGDVKATWGGK